MMMKMALAAAAFAFTCIPACAATISIVSMHYSAAHPVPHLHYDGPTVAGDVATLRDMYESFVKCRISCLGPDGGATAILTLRGEGGDYYEGLAIADFLRENHIATVVERGSFCYSACAFAFLGGSGYSSQPGIGTYIDRMVEPGSTVGFHAPYRNEDAFLSALEQRGAMATQGDTRDSLALMVKELVRWNVDPEVLFRMVGMGPDQTYDLTTATDLYLARVALPPTPSSAWISDPQSALHNVCARLLAIDERGDPRDMEWQLLSGFEQGIGRTSLGEAISGYRLGERPLSIGSCAATDAALATPAELEASLYFTAGLDGNNAPGISFFNREKGWSSAGTGSNPLKRILQKGPLNHFFLPLYDDIDRLDLPGEAAIDANRFNLPLSPLLPLMAGELVVDAVGAGSRVSHSGDVFVFERVGPRELFDSALALPGTGRTYTNDAANELGFVRDGSYVDTAVPFTWFGLLSGGEALVVEAFVVKPTGVAPTDEDMAALRRIQCAADFGGIRLGCT